MKIYSQLQICSWDDLRALHVQGVSVQSHGMSHARFSELSHDGQHEELILSERSIKANVNNTVSIFSFPYGEDGVNKQLPAGLLEHAGYSCPMLYWGGVAQIIPRHYFRLSRIAIGADTNV